MVINCWKCDRQRQVDSQFSGTFRQVLYVHIRVTCLKCSESFQVTRKERLHVARSVHTQRHFKGPYVLERKRIFSLTFVVLNVNIKLESLVTHLERRKCNFTSRDDSHKNMAAYSRFSSV